MKSGLVAQLAEAVGLGIALSFDDPKKPAPAGGKRPAQIIAELKRV